jgi:lysophospholipase L1-like esterase
MILGDSIAVGTANFRKECVAYAKGGINSRDWNKNYSNKDLSAKTVIISLGSNDHVGIRTILELQELRNQVKADRVFWILPAIKPDIQNMVKLVAEQYKDTVLPIARLQTDKVHPSWAGYKELANQTK